MNTSLRRCKRSHNSVKCDTTALTDDENAYCVTLCYLQHVSVSRGTKTDATDKLRDPISCARMWSSDCLLWGGVPAWRVHRDMTDIWHATVVLVIWQVKGRTLRQMVFISLSAACLQGDLGRCSPLSRASASSAGESSRRVRWYLSSHRG